MDPLPNEDKNPPLEVPAAPPKGTLPPAPESPASVAAAAPVATTPVAASVATAPVATPAATVPAAPPAPGGTGAGPSGGGNGGGDDGNGNDNGAGPRAINLNAAKPSPVTAAMVTASPVPTAVLTTGKVLTRWVLSIMAGSILILVLYVWRMEVTTGDDIRHNYGKDLNREDVSLYLARRLQNFSDALAQAKDAQFAISENLAGDEKALIETLNQFPGIINNQERDQLEQCVSQISVKGDRKDTLKPCTDLLDRTKSQGMTAAAAAFSFQMASEASAKLLEQRQSFHEFWLKAAQLILLNLLLPILTAVIGYTFGNQQAQQQSTQR